MFLPGPDELRDREWRVVIEQQGSTVDAKWLVYHHHHRPQEVRAFDSQSAALKQLLAEFKGRP